MKKGSNLLKHLDFMILDILTLELSFFLANVWYAAYSNQIFSINAMYRLLALMLIICVLITQIIDTPYKSILKRQRYV